MQSRLSCCRRAQVGEKFPHAASVHAFRGDVFRRVAPSASDRDFAPQLRKPFGMRASKPPNELAFRKVFILTRFDTVLRPIYSRMVLTCAPFRSCWVITIRKRRLTTCISPNVTCMRPPVHWIHCSSKAYRRRSTRWPGHHSRWPM
jgi:hypothetical protein